MEQMKSKNSWWRGRDLDPARIYFQRHYHSN